MTTTSLVVLKFGGELLEDPARVAALASVIARAPRGLVVVHGGGREIDAALAESGIPKRQVEGLRVTDAATLTVVTGILAGRVNTRLVAAVNAAGGRAVGLTAADAGVAEVRRSDPHRTVDGSAVDLGLVGEPVGKEVPHLLVTLTEAGYTPVVASIAAAREGTLLNVNADTLAADLAARARAVRLVVAGGTPGVLGLDGATIPRLDRHAMDGLIASGVANAGMVAKLRACRRAIEAGVADVVLVDGREPERVARALAGDLSTSLSTRMVA